MALGNKVRNSQKHPELYSVMLIDPSGKIVQYKNDMYMRIEKLLALCQV